MDRTGGSVESVPENKLFLCSELIRISAGGGSKIGNLEIIGPDGCTVTVDTLIAAGSEVRMHCVECPLGKRSCRECRFRGRVKSAQEDSVLGCFVHIEFEGRSWSAEEWRPRHLTSLKSFKAAWDG